MDNKTFNNVFLSVLDVLKEKNINKGGEYTRRDNRFHNFIEGAKMMDMHPMEYLLVLKSKHDVSIRDMVSDITNGLQPSEILFLEKVTDSIMYLIILYAMLTSGEFKPAREEWTAVKF